MSTSGQAGHRQREILRTKEGFCELFFSDHTPPDSPDRLRRYFLQFAILARRTA